jgi:hypothetical protein
MNASGRVRLTIDVGHPTPASSSVRSWPIADIAIRQAVAVLQRARGFAPRPYDWAVPVARAGVSETTEAVVTLAGAARHVRHLADQACGGRPRSQYAAATPRSARRCERTRTRHDGLAAAPIKGFVIRCGNPSILLLNLADRITFHVYLRLSIDRD